jgi:hypothetical protein
MIGMVASANVTDTFARRLTRNPRKRLQSRAKVRFAGMAATLQLDRAVASYPVHS